MTTLYALGVADRFANVYPWENFERNLPLNLAFMLANSDHLLFKQALDFWLSCGREIPKQSYAYAKILKNAKEINHSRF